MSSRFWAGLGQFGYAKGRSPTDVVKQETTVDLRGVIYLTMSTVRKGRND